MRSTYLIFVLIVLGLPSFPLSDPPYVLLRCASIVAGCLFIILSAAWITLRTERKLTGNQRNLFPTLRWFGKRRSEHRIFRSIMFVVFVVIIGWSSIVRDQWGLGHWILIDDVLIILPFLIVEVISTILFHRVDLAIDRKVEERSGVANAAPSHQEKLWIQLRTEHGPWILIGLVVVTIHDTIDWFDLGDADQGIVALVSLVAMMGVSLVVLPIAIRLALPLRTMPKGPVRDRLEGWTRHEHVRFSDILIWKTRHRLANAAVTGILPHLRYVFISETILEQLNPLEVVGVFGHEVGHVRHRHLLSFFIFVTLSLVMLVLVGEGVQRLAFLWLGAVSLFEWIPAYLWLALPHFYFGLGFFSRRFERQADIDGCRASAAFLASSRDSQDISLETPALEPSLLREGAIGFLGALHKVSQLNGMDPAQWSWRQGLLRDRFLFLERIAACPELAVVFDRTTTRLVFGAMFLLILISGVMYFVLSLW